MTLGKLECSPTRDIVFALNAISFTTSIERPRNKEVEDGVVSCTMATDVPFAKCLLPVPMTADS